MTLREARIAAGYTRQKLADLTNINKKNIEKIEAGAIKIENLTARNFIALCDACDIDPHELLPEMKKMKKIYYAHLNPTGTDGEYTWAESTEAEYSIGWEGDVAAYLLNAAIDEDAMLEMMDRPYNGSIHNLPENSIVLSDEDGRPLEIWWAE